MTRRFYDELAPHYHLIFSDWAASIAWQAEILDRLIRQTWGDAATSVLDVACGIGTQALGLAQRGYTVTASDLSPAMVARTNYEAAQPGLAIDASVADMRQAGFVDVHRAVSDYYQPVIVGCKQRPAAVPSS